MELRKAIPEDKTPVLEFCKNTFSWGDYIEDVWENWISEGNFLVLSEEGQPAAISHGYISDGQVWIEGIRVKNEYRRKGFARSLVLEIESIAKKKNCNISKMLIAETNTKSLNLAKSLNYEIEDVWNFYSLLPKKLTDEKNVKVATYSKELFDLILTNISSYVRSWRWLPLSKKILENLIEENKIFINEKNNQINSIAILRESDHFERIILITLVFGNEEGLTNILKYFQNFGLENNCERIQILSKLDKIPKIYGLEKKISFCLLKKQL